MFRSLDILFVEGAAALRDVFRDGQSCRKEIETLILTEEHALRQHSGWIS